MENFFYKLNCFFSFMFQYVFMFLMIIYASSNFINEINHEKLMIHTVFAGTLWMIFEHLKQKRNI